jgi:hypothetical protein
MENKLNRAKLDEIRTGPFPITKIISKHIMEINVNGKNLKYHVNKLVPYLHDDENYSNCLENELESNQIEVVESSFLRDRKPVAKVSVAEADEIIGCSVVPERSQWRSARHVTGLLQRSAKASQENAFESANGTTAI